MRSVYGAGPCDKARARALGRGVRTVAGVDEVGVRALARPFVAAAVILAPDAIIKGLADFKLLTPKRHAALFSIVRGVAVAFSMGRAEVEEVVGSMFIGLHGSTSACCRDVTVRSGPYLGRVIVSGRDYTGSATGVKTTFMTATTPDILSPYFCKCYPTPPGPSPAIVR
jgi:hypothetical protein